MRTYDQLLVLPVKVEPLKLLILIETSSEALTQAAAIPKPVSIAALGGVRMTASPANAPVTVTATSASEPAVKAATVTLTLPFCTSESVDPLDPISKPLLDLTGPLKVVLPILN